MKGTITLDIKSYEWLRNAEQERDVRLKQVCLCIDTLEAVEEYLRENGPEDLLNRVSQVINDWYEE